MLSPRVTICFSKSDNQSNHILQCVTVCCIVLQCVAVRCSVLQCVAVCCSVLQCVAVFVAVCFRVLQCGAMCSCASRGLNLNKLLNVLSESP